MFGMFTARHLVFALVLALCGAFFYHLLFANWEAVYEIAANEDGERFLIDLPDQPLWSTPAPPPYSDFAARFSSDSAIKPGGRVFVHINWEWLLEGLFLNWLEFFVCYGLVYALGFRKSQSIAAAFFFCTGLGLVGGAVVCILFWLVFGGWGPPAPVFFGVIGVLIGSTIGFIHLRKRRVKPITGTNAG